MVEMGQKLKLLRVQNRLTQKQVADRLDLAISAVSSYESGSRFPTYTTLLKLANMYHTSCDYLIGMDEQRTIDVTGLDDQEIEVVSKMVNLLKERHN